MQSFFMRTAKTDQTMGKDRLIYICAGNMSECTFSHVATHFTLFLLGVSLRGKHPSPPH